MFKHLTVSANCLVPVIFGAGPLEQWAITHSLKDCCFWANLLIVYAIPPPLPLSNYLGALTSNLGCFWANLLIVYAIPPPLPLSNYLGALTSNLGCFPLDIEAYPPTSHWLTKCLSIQSLPWFGTTLAARTKTVALPLRKNINRCASTHFGEIQLAPDSIGISPLTTTHPLFFQQQSVGTST